MKIGIIGAGMIGSTLAGLFAKTRHQVALANSRGPDSLAELVAQLGENVKAATVEEAAEFGEVVVATIPFGSYQTLPAQALAYKIVIDTMNYYPQRDGKIDFHHHSSTELVAQHLNQSALVKAFNTIYFKTLGEESSTQKPLADRLTIFIAGDDAGAKAKVAQLIEEIGFAALDTGTLAESTRQEPGTPLYNRPITLAEAPKVLNNG